MDTRCPLGKTDIISPIFCAWTKLEAVANRYIFDRVGLSSSGFKILTFLARKKSATPGEMVIELGITKSNLSQRLRALEAKHFVKRSHTGKDSDQRKVYFLITTSGEKKLHQAAHIAKQAGLSFEKEFTKDEIRQHSAFFSKLTTLLDKKERDLEKLFEDTPSKK
jgi:DNA-binding MarR family transcriptional regulator